MTDYPDIFNELFEQDPRFLEAGRVNYEAFAGRLGWRLNGQQMPPWSQLPGGDQERAAWSAGAYDVIQKCWKDAAPQPRHRRH